MNIFGSILDRSKNEVLKSPTYWDMDIDHSFTPNNLWYITFDKGETSKKKLDYNSFSFHKVQNVLYGHVCFKNLKFQIVSIIYTDGMEPIETFIKSYCNEDSNYVFERSDMPENNWWQLVDLDELSVLPEFENKKNIECFEILMDEYYGKRKDIIDYELKFNLFKASDSPELFNCSDFMYHIGEDAI